MVKKAIATLALAYWAGAALSSAHAQTENVYDFDMTKEQPAYSDSTGYGYDFGTQAVSKKQTAPMFFSVKVPEGDYKVTVTLGSKKYAGETALRAETRVMVVENLSTKKGELTDITFNVCVKTPAIEGDKVVKLKGREAETLGWDNRLTLEFLGEQPAVSRIRIEPNQPAVKIWLCGDSTVTDQDGGPYNSWGQMFPYWFNEKVSVENLAMSGLTTTTFIAQNRLEKIKKEVREGDLIIVEFGHNDEKDKFDGSGAWYNFTHNLRIFIDVARKAKAHIVLVTPTQRRFFENGRIRETHGEYPEATRTVAQREGLPLIDLTAETSKLYLAMGEEGSKSLLVHYPANTFPHQEKALADNTHNNPFGSYEVSKLIVMGLKANGIPVVEYLRDGWTDFDPERFDNPDDFYWPITHQEKNEKPAGN